MIFLNGPVSPFSASLLPRPPLPLTPPSPALTLCDLLLGGVQVKPGRNLSDHNQCAMVSERSSLPSRLLRLGPLRRGSRWDFHGNSAAGGCWALLYLHDNCIQSTMTARDELGGLVGVAFWQRGNLIGWKVMWLFDVTARHWTEEKWCCSYFLYDVAKPYTKDDIWIHICNMKTPNIVYFSIYLWIYNKKCDTFRPRLKATWKLIFAAVFLSFKVFF